VETSDLASAKLAEPALSDDRFHPRALDLPRKNDARPPGRVPRPRDVVVRECQREVIGPGLDVLVGQRSGLVFFFETLRVGRLLALAHPIDARVRSGEYDDLADAARKLGLTRARVTQIANLTMLASQIQEAILAWPLIATGRDPITDRTLRPIVAEPIWERQHRMWQRDSE
jgi:hypothetical protein